MVVVLKRVLLTHSSILSVQSLYYLQKCLQIVCTVRQIHKNSLWRTTCQKTFLKFILCLIWCRLCQFNSSEDRTMHGKDNSFRKHCALNLVLPGSCSPSRVANSGVATGVAAVALATGPLSQGGPRPPRHSLPPGSSDNLADPGGLQRWVIQTQRCRQWRPAF